jgi:hypothetical protein
VIARVKPRNRRPRPARKQVTLARFVPLAVFLATLTAIFLLGGSARADQTGVLFLRPLCVIAVAWSAVFMSREQWLSIRGPALILIALGAMMAIQLVPLPPSLWSLLPGRHEYLETYKALAIHAPWLPISQFPVLTWNALVCLVVPLAALTTYALLPAAGRALAIPVLIAFGLLSALLGIVQVLSGDQSLYLYSIANFGSNCGFFANRNHQAVFQAALLVLVPLARQGLDRERVAPYALNLLAMGAIGLLVFSIFTTGSRVGFALGLLAGLWSGWKIYRLIGDPPKSKLRFARDKFQLSARVQKLIMPVLLAILAATALLAPQSPVLHRLVSDDAEAPIEDMRVAIFENSLAMLPDNLPFGGGAGTFPQVYEGYESAQGISFRYVNHAHDDLLEFVYEFGLLGVVFLLVVLALLARWTLAARRAGGAAWRVAAPTGIVLSIFFLGSLFDYPARSPIGASFVILAIAWLYGSGRLAKRTDQDIPPSR